MNGRTRGWLAARAGGVPPALQAAMELAVDEAEDPALPVHAVLAAAAQACLTRALRNCDERTAATPLLAADALITYACAAAAEHDMHSLDDVLALCAPEVLTHKLTDEAEY